MPMTRTGTFEQSVGSPLDRQRIKRRPLSQAMPRSTEARRQTQDATARFLPVVVTSFSQHVPVTGQRLNWLSDGAIMKSTLNAPSGQDSQLSSILDVKDALHRLGDDDELLRDIIQIYVEDAPAIVEKILAASKAADA